MTRAKRCPHCGNRDRATIEDNGLPSTHPDITYLCTARVRADRTSFDHLPERELPGFDPETRTAFCGAQWTPNDEGGAA